MCVDPLTEAPQRPGMTGWRRAAKHFPTAPGRYPFVRGADLDEPGPLRVQQFAWKGGHWRDTAGRFFKVGPRDIWRVPVGASA